MPRLCSGPPPRAARGGGQRAFDWALRSRDTGRVVIVQVPNLPLALFLLLRGVEALLSPHGAVGAGLQWAGTAALAWWAIDELLRGVNPFRRLLGLAVLGWPVVGLVLR